MPTARQRRCDVLVIGGGASGIPAALAAARCGAKVILVEEDPALGGAPLDNFITYPCGNPKSGIYREMVAAIDGRYRMPSAARVSTGRREEDWYLPWAYSLVTDEMLAAAGENLAVLAGVRAREPIVTTRGGRAQVGGAIVPLRDGGELRIEAGVTIDATGTGCIGHQAGCQEMFGREGHEAFNEPLAAAAGDGHVQSVTLMFFSQRLGTEPFDMRQLDVVGMIDPGFGWVAKDPEAFVARDTGFYLHWGCAVPCSDPRDELAVADAQARALRKIAPDLETLWKHGWFAYVAPRIGVRETRRFLGEYVLNENDLRSGAMPADVIAIGQHHIDLWGQDLTPEQRAIPPFGLPYRCLLPVGVDGLLLAGKTLSASHIALGPLRVQPTVAAAGQAAGVAAAMACDRGCPVSDVDVSALQASLAGPGQNLCLDPRTMPPEVTDRP